MATVDLASVATAECPDSGALLTGHIAAIQTWLTSVDAADLGDRERIQVVAALERLTGSVTAVQARLTAAYASSQRALGCSARGVATEVGLARRVGLSRATRLVAAARMLADDLPETLEHLECGRLSEARAVIVAGQLSALDPAEREEVDDLLAGDLPRLGDAEVRDAVDAAITRIDPDAVEARRRAACRQRRVTVRPGEDGMAWLSVHTTAIEAAAALNTLHAHADSVIAGAGGLADLPEDAEGRSHAEVMADAALSRLTGRTVHEGPPVEVQLLMTDTDLLGGGCPPGDGVPLPSEGGRPPGGTGSSSFGAGGPLGAGHGAGGAGAFGGGGGVARVVGVGPIPVGAARDLIRQTPTPAPPGRVGSAAASARSPGRPVAMPERAEGPHRLFEGPDWAFDERTPEMRAMGHAADLARWRRDEREAVRVTVRRVHISSDGRNPVGIDARRRVMPTVVRELVGGPGPDEAEQPTRTGGGALRSPPAADHEVTGWFAWLHTPARPADLATLMSDQRCARGLLRLLVVLRDQRCRVPWCTAPIRHLDHVTAHRDGGPTALTGLTGDCAGHNLAKEDPGHAVVVTHDGVADGHPHTIRWTTPSGHAYDSVAPPVLGWGTEDHPSDRDTVGRATTDTTATTATARTTGDTDAPLAPDGLSPLEAHLTALLAA